MEEATDRWAWTMAAVLFGAVLVLPWPGLDGLIPEAVLVQARRNSEALAFTAFVILMVPAALRRPSRPSGRWWALVAVVYLVTELATNDILPQWVITLNEGLLAVGIIGAYLYGRADLKRRPVLFYPLLAIVVLAGELPIPGWDDGAAAAWIVEHAEAWGFALITGIYLDFVRPWPFRPVRFGWRWLWYPAMIVIPATLSYLNPHGVDAAAASGPAEASLVWVQRITEAFVAGLIIAGYYDIRLGLRRAE